LRKGSRTRRGEIDTRVTKAKALGLCMLCLLFSKKSFERLEVQFTKSSIHVKAAVVEANLAHDNVHTKEKVGDAWFKYVPNKKELRDDSLASDILHLSSSIHLRKKFLHHLMQETRKDSLVFLICYH